jgi:hypothetical protein
VVVPSHLDEQRQDREHRDPIAAGGGGTSRRVARVPVLSRGRRQPRWLHAFRSRAALTASYSAQEPSLLVEAERRAVVCVWCSGNRRAERSS